MVGRTWTIRTGGIVRAVLNDSELRRIALAGPGRSFAPSVRRLRLAHAASAMRCGIFTFRKGTA